MSEKGILYNRLLFLPLFLLVFCFVLANAQEQEVAIKVRIDTSQIVIGDQIKLHLDVSHKRQDIILWPVLPDTLGKIEILNRSKIDTSSSGNMITERQSYTITCFDSGYYVIPPFRFVIGNDTANVKESEALLLSVHTLPVDTTQAIKDIKHPIEAPLTFREALPYIVGGIMAIAFILLIVFLIKKYKKNSLAESKHLPTKPAHEVAREELQKLEKEKLWQQGFIKAYHSGLSDIIRNYIEQRYTVPAMELTTDEIILHMDKDKTGTNTIHTLKQILELADLVKFAKTQALPSENEMSMKNAYLFVERTMLHEDKNTANNENTDVKDTAEL